MEEDDNMAFSVTVVVLSINPHSARKVREVSDHSSIVDMTTLSPFKLELLVELVFDLPLFGLFFLLLFLFLLFSLSLTA